MINFQLTESIWQAAEQYLVGKPCGTKYEKVARDPESGEKVRDKKRSPHSFVIIRGVIYALGDLIDEGGLSLVKQGLTKEGVLVAIKIDALALEDEKSDAYQAATINKLLIGQGLRKAANMHIKFKNPAKNITTDQKRYTVMHWRGKSLIEQIETQDCLTSTQKRMLSLRLCLLVEQLCSQGIVHADLKAENITASIKGNDIEVKVIDLDFAKLLKKDKTFIIADKSSGSPGFVSSEVVLRKCYSALSDQFALAVMLLYQVDITCAQVPYLYYNQYLNQASKNLSVGFRPLEWLEKRAPNLVIEAPLRAALAGMLANDYKKRTDCSRLVLYLCDKLEKDPGLEEELKTQVREIRMQAVLKQFKDNSNEQIDLPMITKTSIEFSSQQIADAQIPEVKTIISSLSKKP